MALIDKRSAVAWKYPDLEHGEDKDYFETNRDDVTGNSTWTWNTSKYPEPTVVELQEWTDKSLYPKQRRVAYPSIKDQLDMIYHDMKDSTTTHADAIEAVKTKWPKDGTGPVE